MQADRETDPSGAGLLPPGVGGTLLFSFFLPLKPLFPGPINNRLGILAHESVERAVVFGVLFDGFNLVAWNIPADRLAVLTVLQVVVRPVLSLLDYTEFAPLHALNVCDLVKNPGWCRCFVFHGEMVYVFAYTFQ